MSKPHEIISWSSGCDKFKECYNNQCFFKQRDSFGFQPFGFLGNQNQEITKKYGPWIVPKITADMGTNVIYVICDSFISEQEKK